MIGTILLPHYSGEMLLCTMNQLVCFLELRQNHGRYSLVSCLSHLWVNSSHLTWCISYKWSLNFTNFILCFQNTRCCRKRVTSRIVPANQEYCIFHWHLKSADKTRLFDIFIWQSSFSCPAVKVHIMPHQVSTIFCLLVAIHQVFYIACYPMIFAR